MLFTMFNNSFYKKWRRKTHPPRKKVRKSDFCIVLFGMVQVSVRIMIKTFR